MLWVKCRKLMFSRCLEIVFENEKDWTLKKLCHSKRRTWNANFERKKRVLAALQSCSRVLAEGDADEQLLFHLFDILFKCFTCRDVQIPRDKRADVSCFHDDTTISWPLRRRFFIKSFLANASLKSNEIDRSVVIRFSAALKDKGWAARHRVLTNFSC